MAEQVPRFSGGSRIFFVGSAKGVLNSSEGVVKKEFNWEKVMNA